MTHGNIIVNVLDISSTNDKNSKDSDSYTCIIVNLKLFMLIMCIGFEALVIHLLNLYSIIKLSIVVVDAGSSSAAFISPVSFVIDSKGNVYPLCFESVFQFITIRDTEVNKEAAKVVCAPYTGSAEPVGA